MRKYKSLFLSTSLMQKGWVYITLVSITLHDNVKENPPFVEKVRKRERRSFEMNVRDLWKVKYTRESSFGTPIRRTMENMLRN